MPKPMAKDFWLYRKSLLKKRVSPKSKKSLASQPYWILLPIWVRESYSKSKKELKKNRQFLTDVLWGQYCLFLFIRMQDDVLDGHVKSSSILFVADQFLFEAQRIFSNYFNYSSRFWQFYQQSLQGTTRAIFHVNRLEQSPKSNPEDLLKAYANVNAVFYIGSVAACIYFGKVRHFSYIKKFCDEIAIASQILDDFQDIEQDMKRKRFNYVANVLLRAKVKKKINYAEALKLISRNLLYTPLGSELFADVRRRFRRAGTILSTLGIKEVEKVFKHYDKVLEQMEISFHRRRVRSLFGKI
ncbi:MAG: hypothetical protein HY707_05930 [Ignavibacteriae bacterium]|nr:hypothetical protein [Ignavibacteriota bacterium]